LLNDFEKLMFDRVSTVLGGDQKSFSYFKTENSSTDILFCKDTPAPEYLTCATLGLVNQETNFQANGKNIRVEFIGLSTTKFGDTLGKIMAVTYKNIVEKNLPCAYGVIYDHILDELLPNSDMKHILFTTPPLFWEDSLGTVELDDKNILTWLYAMPISNNERKSIVEAGDNFKEAMVHLQELFTLKNVDVFNLDRKSIV